MRSADDTTLSAATALPCMLRSGTASANTPSSCSSRAMAKSWLRTSAMRALNALWSTAVCGVSRGSSRPLSQVVNSARGMRRQQHPAGGRGVRGQARAEVQPVGHEPLAADGHVARHDHHLVAIEHRR